MDVTKDDREALARIVKTRRDATGLSRPEVQRRGGPSDYTLARIERADEFELRPKTRRQLEDGLSWSRGAVDRILDGTATEQDLNPNIRVGRGTASINLGALGVGRRETDQVRFRFVGNQPAQVSLPEPGGPTVTVAPGDLVTVTGVLTDGAEDAWTVDHPGIGERAWPMSLWEHVRMQTIAVADVAEGRGAVGTPAVRVDPSPGWSVATASPEAIRRAWPVGGPPAAIEAALRLQVELAAFDDRTAAEDALRDALARAVPDLLHREKQERPADE